MHFSPCLASGAGLNGTKEGRKAGFQMTSGEKLDYLYWQLKFHKDRVIDIKHEIKRMEELK